MQPTVIFLHNRYRTTGGEERALADLAWLASDRLGCEVSVLERSSADLGRAGAAAALLRGGLDPDRIGAEVRRRGADVVHAHNLLPGLGWRALAAARDAGARVVLHLHNTRLVCAVGTCIDARGEDCTRCHGRDTRPGVRLRCRGSRAEAVAYAVALSAWQERLVEQADVVVVPSRAARDRLRALGAPLRDDRTHVVPHVVRSFDEAARPAADGYALVTTRLAREKDVDVAVRACAIAGLELVVAGDGPELARLRAAGGARFVGRVEDLRELRAGAGVVLAPTRAHETFGLAALEAMAAGLPVVASRAGALAELREDGVALVPVGDPDAMAAAARRLRGDAAAGAAARDQARALAAPDVVAPRLRAVYAAALAR